VPPTPDSARRKIHGFREAVGVDVAFVEVDEADFDEDDTAKLDAGFVVVVVLDAGFVAVAALDAGLVVVAALNAGCDAAC
jgi:hypothetical protein